MKYALFNLKLTNITYTIFMIWHSQTNNHLLTMRFQLMTTNSGQFLDRINPLVQKFLLAVVLSPVSIQPCGFQCLKRTKALQSMKTWLIGNRWSKSCLRCAPSTLHKKNRAFACVIDYKYHNKIKTPFHNQLPKLQPTSQRIQYLDNIWPIICKIIAERNPHRHLGKDIRLYYEDPLI